MPSQATAENCLGGKRQQAWGGSAVTPAARAAPCARGPVFIRPHGVEQVLIVRKRVRGHRGAELLSLTPEPTCCHASWFSLPYLLSASPGVKTQA